MSASVRALISMLRLPTVLRVRGVGKSTHYVDVQNGLVTPPVHIGERSVAWPDSEIEAIVAARIAGKSNDEIRELVSQLIAERQNVFVGPLRRIEGEQGAPG